MGRSRDGGIPTKAGPKAQTVKKMPRQALGGTDTAQETRRRRAASPHELAILNLMVKQPEKWWYGYEMAQRMEGVEPATVYNILLRLNKKGLLESQWVGLGEGTKPRHEYRLNPDGVMYAGKELATATASVHQEVERLLVKS